MMQRIKESYKALNTLLRQAVVILLLLLLASNVAAQQQTITIPATLNLVEPSQGPGGTTNTLSFGTWPDGNSLTLTYTYGDDTAKGGATCTGGADFLNGRRQRIINRNESITLEPYSVCSDTVDEPRETYVVVIIANNAIFDKNEPNCLTSRHCSTTVTIIDDDPTIITNDGLDQNFDIKEGEAKTITLTLGRTLVEDESISVDILSSGSGTNPAASSDYNLNLRSGRDFNAGVTFTGTKLTFGEGAKVATLVFRAIHDDDTDENPEFVLIDTSSSASNSNTIDGGATLSTGNRSLVGTINNNPNKPLRIRAKVLLEGPLQ